MQVDLTQYYNEATKKFDVERVKTALALMSVEQVCDSMDSSFTGRARRGLIKSFIEQIYTLKVKSGRETKAEDMLKNFYQQQRKEHQIMNNMELGLKNSRDRRLEVNKEECKRY